MMRSRTSAGIWGACCVMDLAPADKIRIIIFFLLLCKGLFSPRLLGPARPGAHGGRNSALCGPWRRFRGAAAPIPCPRPLSRFLRVPVRFGCIAWRLSSPYLAMLASSIAWRPFFLGVQPCGLPARAGVRVERRRSACLLFPAKPLLTTFQRPRCSMWAQAVELAPARRAAPGRCLAAGQPFLSGHRPR